MPATIKSVVHMLRLMFRARWDVIEPRRAEAAYKKPSKERCAEIVSLVLSDYDELNSDLARLELSGDDAFHEVFDPEFWNEIDGYSSEWVALTSELKATAPENAKELSNRLTALRSNNAKWMNIGAKQFAKSVARICKTE
jgi:hypothetical protein